MTQEERSVYKKKLIHNIKIYTNHCVHQYKQGLCIKEELHTCSQNSIEKWNQLNTYQRDINLMVLDLISIWPTYDYS
ncbi:hypothetical protein BTXL6_11130 [Bacillus thuringiensis]|nr:hypothetical protein BTXL6_28695 [Bacillus thuringiensis]ALL21964.1 hypothetical protein BTXL6_11130 [Bacillus thuringiensis]